MRDLFALTRREFVTSHPAPKGAPQRYSRAVIATSRRATQRKAQIGRSKQDCPERTKILLEAQQRRERDAGTV